MFQMRARLPSSQRQVLKGANVLSKVNCPRSQNLINRYSALLWQQPLEDQVTRLQMLDQENVGALLLESPIAKWDSPVRLSFV
jgi:hypothetical protein